MKKTYLIVAVSFFSLVMLASMAAVAYAYDGNPQVRGPGYTLERHQAVTQAFAANDFFAWQILMKNRPIAKIINTAEKFAKFASARQLALDGKFAEAKAIRQELGLNDNPGQGRGLGKNKAGFRVGSGQCHRLNKTK